ncbi:type IIL restriction-modification enzyme MmeI [Streptococcus halitosis]|uniref:type IIL restriction-modification enzyme MmeI n=1 Tax=Streptococcus halitosis TaxID=2172545 RepID=UPI003B427C53
MTDYQKEKTSKIAPDILNRRALSLDSSLTNLYKELTMKVELHRAHKSNDKGVTEANGLTKIVDDKKTWLTESKKCKAI